jgi:uncharacterized membrane protein YccC
VLPLNPKIKAALATLIAAEAAILAAFLNGNLSGREAISAGILAAAPVLAGYLKGDSSNG